MATLQKFKLLATQCAVAGSPTRSPTASPVIHLRRRKTLRMLLYRTDRRRFHRRTPDRDSSHRDDDFDGDDVREVVPEKARARHKLKDLFVSSPSPPNDSGGGAGAEVVGLFPGRSGGSGGVRRPVTAAFRYRLLRRAWRPMLVTIPELGAEKTK